MIKTFNCINPYSFLENKYKNSEGILIAVVGKNTNAKEFGMYVSNFHNKTGGKTVVLQPLALCKNIGQSEKYTNLTLIEKLIKKLGKNGVPINFLKIGSIIENKHSIVNKALNSSKKGKKFSVKNPKSSYFLISKVDVELAIDLVVKSNIKGQSFDITLNKLELQDIVFRINKYHKLLLGNVGEEKLNEKLIENQNLRLIKFKPQVTVEDYEKSITFSISPSTKKKNKLNLKKYKPALKPVLAGLLLVLTLSIVDFGLDNYFLYKSLTSGNVEYSLFYANKLRNKKLPGKIGNNYTNTYNTIYYGLSAVKAYENPQQMPTDSIKSFANKAKDYFDKTEKDFYLTQNEKDEYEKYKPVAQAFFNKIEFIDLLKLKDFSKGEKNILVLIQNGNELRPTGGFIGSYAVIKTKDFKILDTKFDDIYNIDGTLEKKYPEILTSMPELYQEFFKSNTLYARDANLILDSDRRNKIILNYFETALNTNIDAVVYLNTDSAKTLLSFTGPIYLGTYNTEVTSENVDTLAQSMSEENYYEGSSQKKDFLNVLGARAVNEVKTNNIEVNDKTLSSLISAINNKEALIYFKDKPYSQVVQKLNLDQKIANGDEKQDYLYLIESNLGENKVNKLTEKQVEYNITYDARRGLKLIDLTITILNQSDTYSWPYGDYEGVLNIAMQKNVELTKGIVLTPKTNGDEKEVDITRSIDKQGINNTRVFSVPFVVKPTNKTTIKLAFEDSDKDYIKNDNHSIFIAKQPGAKPYDLIYNFNIPDIKKESKKVVIDKDTNIDMWDSTGAASLYP